MLLTYHHGHSSAVDPRMFDHTIGRLHALRFPLKTQTLDVLWFYKILKPLSFAILTLCTFLSAKVSLMMGKISVKQTQT